MKRCGPGIMEAANRGGRLEPLPVALVGERYWRKAFDVDFLLDEGVIDQEDRELFWFAETAQEIWDGIVRWHALSRAAAAEAPRAG